MKMLLTILLFFISIASFAQTADTEKQSFEIHGYVNGIRLDSIKAFYAEVYYKSWLLDTPPTDYQYPNLSNSTPTVICFSYKKVKNNEEMAVKDSQGNYISLKGDYSELLNFFRFNGWDLFKMVYNDFKTGSYYSLMKKTGK